MRKWVKAWLKRHEETIEERLYELRVYGHLTVCFVLPVAALYYLIALLVAYLS